MAKVTIDLEPQAYKRLLKAAIKSRSTIAATATSLVIEGLRPKTQKWPSGGKRKRQIGKKQKSIL